MLRQKLELLDSDTGGLLYSGSIRLQASERVDLSRLIPPRRKVEPRLWGGLFLPLSRAARSTLPNAPVAGLQLHVRNVFAAQWTGELDASMLGGAGTTPSLDQPYDLTGLHLQAGLGRTFELDRRLYLEPQLKVGNLWLWRTFRTLQAHETLRAATLSPALEFGATPSDGFRIGLRLETSLFYARLEGPRALHAIGSSGCWPDTRSKTPGRRPPHARGDHRTRSTVSSAACAQRDGLVGRRAVDCCHSNQRRPGHDPGCVH